MAISKTRTFPPPAPPATSPPQAGRVWLSKSFDLTEFIRSPKAQALGLNNTPPASAVQALRLLCQNVLQPLRDYYGKPVHVTSGYRCEALNAAISRNPKSQHTMGEAADLWIEGVTLDAIMGWLAESSLPFDQAVLETSRGVVHISHTSRHANRRELLREIGKTSRYEMWPCP